MFLNAQSETAAYAAGAALLASTVFLLVSRLPLRSLVSRLQQKQAQLQAEIDQVQRRKVDAVQQTSLVPGAQVERPQRQATHNKFGVPVSKAPAAVKRVGRKKAKALRKAEAAAEKSA